MKIDKLIAVCLLVTMLLGTVSGCAKTSEEENPAGTETEDTNTADDNTAQDGGDDGSVITAANAYYSFCSEGLDANGFFEGVTASDYVTLPEYKGLKLSEVTDEEIQVQVDALCQNFASYEQLEGTVEDGTTVNIDYVGSVDGVEFSGGSTQGQGTTVTIGVTSYIDGFLDQLIGHETGENFDINVTFPDPYLTNEELSGKEAVFNITINYIQGELIVPELSDEIAQQSGFNTAEELKADIEGWLLGQNALDLVFAELDCSELPEAVLDYYHSYMEGYYENYALTNYGIDLTTFLGYMGYETFDDLYDGMYDEVFALAVKALAYQAIAEKEGLTVTSEDVSTYGYTGFDMYYGTGYTKQLILQERIIPEFLVANASIG